MCLLLCRRKPLSQSIRLPYFCCSLFFASIKWIEDQHNSVQSTHAPPTTRTGHDKIIISSARLFLYFGQEALSICAFLPLLGPDRESLGLERVIILVTILSCIPEARGWSALDSSGLHCHFRFQCVGNHLQRERTAGISPLETFYTNFFSIFGICVQKLI